MFNEGEKKQGEKTNFERSFNAPKLEDFRGNGVEGENAEHAAIGKKKKRMHAFVFRRRETLARNKRRIKPVLKEKKTKKQAHLYFAPFIYVKVRKFSLCKTTLSRALKYDFLINHLVFFIVFVVALPILQFSFSRKTVYT